MSAAAAVVGDLLGIRPIISLNEGVSKVEAKVRGDAAVPPAMVKWVSSRVDNVRDMPYIVGYTSSKEKRDELVKLCKKTFGHAPLTTFQLGAAVSAQHRTPMPSPLLSRGIPANAALAPSFRKKNTAPGETSVSPGFALSALRLP